MSYEEQCLIDALLFAFYILKYCWLYILIAIPAIYAGAKALEKHYLEK